MAKSAKLLNKNDLSRKRQRKKKSKTILICIFCVAVLAGAVFVMRLPGLAIKEIKVSETMRVSAPAIREIAEKQVSGNYLWVLPRNNLLLYPKNVIIRQITSLSPAILSVKAVMGLDLTLSLNISERLGEALWCDSLENCFFMDSEGIVFAEASDNSNFLKYYGLIEGEPIEGSASKRYGEEKFFPNLSQFVEQIKDLGLKPRAVEVVGLDRAQIDFEDNSYLIFLPKSFNSKKERDTLLSDITLFINDLREKNGGAIPSFEYIDARYGNKIFYRIKE